MKAHPEYLARNLQVANCVGLKEGLGEALRKLNQPSRHTPKWLIKALEDARTRTYDILLVLVRHRDECPRWLTDEEGGKKGVSVYPC